MSDAAVSAFLEAWPEATAPRLEVAGRLAREALAVALEDFLGDEEIDGRIPVALSPIVRTPVW